VPITPSGEAVEPLMRAVDGARWVRYDEAHRLVFVGRVTDHGGCMVHSYDIVDGTEHDAPWPVDVWVAAMAGIEAAFEAAVAERISRGY
jgi:NADH:ubiquinone oxidoreductase subunit B-like Fe-S oxidoreductase